MNQGTLVCSALLLAATPALSAAEFPLHFKSIPTAEVMDFPGGYGATGPLVAARPGGIVKEPKAVSHRPLYAECRVAPNGGVFLARLDESAGDAKGYDQLVVDLNQNGDLTDDPVAGQVTPKSERPQVSSGQVLFGPIQASAGKLVAGGAPSFLAQAYVYNRGTFSSIDAPPFAGSLRLKAAWYLETAVDVAGQKQTVGVYDADGNLQLGDTAQPQIMRSGGRDSNWYFGRGDVWLVDANHSGRFENDALQSEAVPFGPLLYLGSKACQVSLAPDCQALRVEPWSEPLAEVALEPQAGQVHSLTLAWERLEGKWQLLRPAVVDGKLKVPPGNYRLYTCELLGKGAPSEQVMVSAFERTMRTPLSFMVDRVNTLRCGTPLRVEVTTARTRAEPQPGGFFSPTGRVSDADAALRISASLVGAGGEVYSVYLKGERLAERPARPTFTILDVEGKEVIHGNLEYG